MLTAECFERLKARYDSGLTSYIDKPAAQPLLDGKACGCEVLSARLSATEVVKMHAELLHPKLLNSSGLEAVRIFDRASEFLAECLAAFDMQNVLKESRLKDDFISAVSHELRTPLTSLLGMSELLRRGQLDEQKSVKAIETICRASQNEARIVDDFLEVSRIMTGRLRLEPTQADLVTIVKTAEARAHSAAERKEIGIDVIEDVEVVPIFADPGRLERAFWHLLSNAVKFTPQRGHIQVRISANESEAEVAVRDTGIGITTRQLSRVFDRFLQVDADIKQRFGGLGTGLMIVRNIVELHGGSVRAESPGENLGATFTVTLPLKMD